MSGCLGDQATGRNVLRSRGRELAVTNTVHAHNRSSVGCASVWVYALRMSSQILVHAVCERICLTQWIGDWTDPLVSTRHVPMTVHMLSDSRVSAWGSKARLICLSRLVKFGTISQVS